MAPAGPRSTSGKVKNLAVSSYLLHMSSLLRSAKLAKRSLSEDLTLTKCPRGLSVVVVERLLKCAPNKAALSNVAQLMDFLAELTQRDSEGLMAYFERRLQEINEIAASQHETEQTQ